MTERKSVFYGAKVKFMLDDNGLTAAEIARKAGVERSLLSSYMHGKRNPKRITVQKIADALHVNISEISGYRDDEPMKEIPVVSLVSDAASEKRNESVFQFVAKALAKEVELRGQAAVARSIGISQSNVNTLVNGKSDIRKLPLSAFLNLCPMLVRFDLASGEVADALHVNISEISGYRDDDGENITPCLVQPTGNDFSDAVLRFIHAEISRQVATENQSIVSKRIGLSHPQVNRIVNGKADLSMFPVGALLRLCPQIINRDVLNNGITRDDTLAATIEHIKLLADRITDTNVARTVETMLKGLVGE